MEAHCSILAWKIPWMEEPVGLQSRSHKESDTTECTRAHAQHITTPKISSTFNYGLVGSNQIK